MDLSKLPRLSSTPTPPPNAAPPDAAMPDAATPDAAMPDAAPLVDAAAPPSASASPPTAPPLAASPYYAAAPSGVGADAWIGIAIGLILLFIQPFPKYVCSVLTHRPFDTGLSDTTTGAPIAYRDLPQYWSDLSVSVFGMVLIVDGIVIGLARSPAVVMAAFALTVVGTLANLAYVVLSYNQFGLAILSALAVAIGGYIALYQWKLLSTLKAQRVFALRPRP